MTQRSVRPFSQLDASGRFHRDSALGRMFHPGAVSFREICATDSLHVLVLRENRLSVHVDRVSPLVARAGRCRYSVVRTVAHNVAVVLETVAGAVLRRPSRPRCHLDCEIVWVPDEASPAVAPESQQID